MPTQPNDPGHIDKSGPPQVIFGSLASSGGATPMWDGKGCSGAWCHGAVSPLWSDGPSVAYCGTCHAIPPKDANHPGPLGLNDCATCHPQTMKPNGAFVMGGNHINGVVDAQ